jgi:peptidoglycan/xylan/chitin deacetylase (PgdA/CDA1 family)
MLLLVETSDPSVQLFLRRNIVHFRMKKYRDIWPIDEHAATPPTVWSGWPEGKRFALVLTHDVDTARGAGRCIDLATMEDSLGFRSSFNIVPERYPIPKDLRHSLAEMGFEVGVHGLNHDGKYFDSREIFLARAQKINQYLKEWNAVGYRTPTMLHNLEWIAALNIEYDASTFDTDPFEPQADGVRTIFPFRVPANSLGRGYIELPYTLPQDFTVFVLFGETSIEIWRKKLDWIAEKRGMALLNVHPDYMAFDDAERGAEEYPASYYKEFLEYVLRRYQGVYWNPLPSEMARFWKRLEDRNGLSDLLPAAGGVSSRGGSVHVE